MRPFAEVIKIMRGVGLRPTRQRMALAKILFENGPRHVTAETLHGEAKAEATGDANGVSLATVYNTLHQFTAVGLLRKIVVDSARSYFDTTTQEHGHFYHADTGVLEDMPEDVVFAHIPATPMGTKITGIDVVVRLKAE